MKTIQLKKLARAKKIYGFRKWRSKTKAKSDILIAVIIKMQEVDLVTYTSKSFHMRYDVWW